MPDELRTLQDCLPAHFKERGLDHLRSLMAECGLDLNRIVQDRMRKMDGEDFVFLDAGCGTGHMAEEFARKQSLAAHQFGFRGRIHAIGLDLNPLPSPIYKSRSAVLYKGSFGSKIISSR